MPPVIIAGAIAGAGALGGSAIASSGANKAANTQAQAANYAADLQKQAADQALAENQRQFNINQQNIAPWLQQGTGALANLSYLLGVPFQQQAGQTTGQYQPALPNFSERTVPGSSYYNNRAKMIDGNTGELLPDFQGNVPQPQGATPQGNVSLSSLVNPNLGSYGSLMQQFPEQFQAPTNVTEQNDPGFQFRLQQGQQALERSAAARGNLLTGGTAKDINQFAQDYASNEYGNVYNRAFNEYATRYNQYQNNQTNQYNRLASLSGVGQQSAAQLGYLGQNAANNSANILLGSANAIGQQANNAAAARASGYVGGANAWGSALGNIGGNIGQSILLSSLLKGTNGGASTPTYDIPSWMGSMGG